MRTVTVQAPRRTGEVFSLIRDGRALTRSEVGRLTGLSRTAVAARLSALLGSGLVVEGDDDDRARSTGGRPPTHLRFNRDAGVVLAGAIGRSRTQLAVCDLDGDVLASTDLDQEVGATPAGVMPLVAQRLRVAAGPGGAGRRRRTRGRAEHSRHRGRRTGREPATPRSCRAGTGSVLAAA